MSRTIPYVLTISLAFGHVDAGELTFEPVPVGNEGPLLFLVHPEDEQGKSYSDKGPRKEALYLYNPGYHKSPQKLWIGDDPPIPEPIARLEQNLILMSHNDRSFLLQLDTGLVSSLLPGEDKTKVVQVEGTTVYFLRRTEPYGFDSGGYRLGEGSNGVSVVKEYYRPRDYLHIFSPSMKRPVLLVEAPLEKVLCIEQDAIWAITAKANRKLCRISKMGKVDEIIAFDDHWVARETRHFFSPGGRYLALSFPHDQHDFNKERELVVINLQEKRIVYSHERITSLWPTYGNLPSLHVQWVDETRLSYGFSEFVVDVDKGTRLERPEAEELERQLLPEGEPNRKTHGFFDYRFGLVYFGGTKKPISRLPEEEIAICAKGEWAAFCSPNDDKTYLVDGRNKKKTLLLPGWSCNIAWLPWQD